MYQSQRTASWIASLASFLLPAVAAYADTPKLSLDMYGDPLPRGAVVRLGSTRLRLFGLSARR